MKLRSVFILFLIIVVAPVLAQPVTGVGDSTTKPPAIELKKSGLMKRGDRAYNRSALSCALKFYSKALTKLGPDEDTLYLWQKIADSYREYNDPVNAGLWYKKLVDRNTGNPKNKFWYATALKSNQNYALAKECYLRYKADNPTDTIVDEALTGLENVPRLLEDPGVYGIRPLGINTPKSEFGSVFFVDTGLVFTSNRGKGKTVSTKKKSKYRLYTAGTDSTGEIAAPVSRIKGCKLKGRFNTGGAAWFERDSQLIFTRGKCVKDTTPEGKNRRVKRLKLYTMNFPAVERMMTPLPFNSDAYSNAHPAFTADGKMLYFSSDKPGGQGGADLYVSFRDQNGVWGNPQNLGAGVNSKYDETYPFIASDGTLYFSRNSLDGLGGLDIYSTRPENGTWSEPENLGAPVNSSRDDFAFIMDSAYCEGYFTSNRPGGAGEDDLYHFTFDEDKIKFGVTVRVVDAKTQTPLPNTALKITYEKKDPENEVTDSNGEKALTFKGVRTCTVKATSPGYFSGMHELSYSRKHRTIIIPLTSGGIRLLVRVRVKENGLPIPNVDVSLSQNGTSVAAYATNDTGFIETELREGTYNIALPDYPDMKGQFSEKDVQPDGGVRYDITIPMAELIIHVRLAANCFSSSITLIDLKTGAGRQVSPDKKGEFNLHLKANAKYLVEHGGTTDTVSTVGLKPGADIEAPCNFFLGQTWVIPNIYYDFDKWQIRPDGARELDKLVALLKNNPRLSVEFGSHTDCVADAHYNMTLSNRRAHAAVSYIVAHGVEASRIIASGYGETQPVNNCSCEEYSATPCTEAQNAANRRTEIKVIRYSK